jgi:hypothetical protein
MLMRGCWLIALVVANLASLARAQIQDAGSSEIRKQWVLGEHLARDLEQRAGIVDDVSLLDYLQRIEDRISSAIGANPNQIRVTRSPEKSAALLPNGALYLSSGMLARIETEAELAGLLAHELAHSQRGNRPVPQSGGIPILFPACIFASRQTPMMLGYRTHDAEVAATVGSRNSVEAGLRESKLGERNSFGGSARSESNSGTRGAARPRLHAGQLRFHKATRWNRGGTRSQGE